MSFTLHPTRLPEPGIAPHEHPSPPRRHRLGRRTLAGALLLVLLLAATPALLYAHAHAAATKSLTAAPLLPADQFMQSIVTDDGALGWHQLCPSLQAQLPMDEVVQQADAQRAAVTKAGVSLTVQFMGSQPRPGGGTERDYVVTAHWPNGTTQQRTYNVLTQSSGCVEDVQNH